MLNRVQSSSSMRPQRKVVLVRPNNAEAACAVSWRFGRCSIPVTRPGPDAAKAKQNFPHPDPTSRIRRLESLPNQSLIRKATLTGVKWTLEWTRTSAGKSASNRLSETVIPAARSLASRLADATVRVLPRSRRRVPLPLPFDQASLEIHSLSSISPSWKAF